MDGMVRPRLKGPEKKTEQLGSMNDLSGPIEYRAVMFMKAVRAVMFMKAVGKWRIR